MPSPALQTGTLALVSGPDNPTTLNFLPETHIVVIEAAKIVGNYETFWEMLRAAYGEGAMPRTVNFITGPSRSADIEQTLLLGAHGPRALHIIIVRRMEVSLKPYAESDRAQKPPAGRRPRPRCPRPSCS